MGEPSEHTAPPKKRRRRRLLVALAFGLISLTTWWNWPRGDARLVGKWRYQLEDGSPGVLTLHANGTAVSEVPPTYRCRFYWHVENERLVFGAEMDERLLPACRWLAAHVRKWTGTLYSFGQSEQFIADLTPDRLVLTVDAITGTRTTTYERIPD